ncbi:hypothetical protein SASPL_118902 [Salvia splendens]|uniref:RING-type domain-containing protein n=1 Tax=Salvia splendens TaxID=180675 RepID=A0A8X8Y0J5_SALSN|nr:hypothetical protein SASPL_118902 [Salvia splendens]
MQPPILRSIPAFGVASSFSGATALLRRSYVCYNCNYPFHISPTAAAIADSDTSSSAFPSPFRCPRCHLRHLISHHTICAAPRRRPPPLPPSSRSTRRRKDDPPPAVVSSTTSAAPSTQPCSICLEDFDISSDAASVTPCKHYFHKDCLAPWLRKKKTCPMCRRELPYKIRSGTPPFSPLPRLAIEGEQHQHGYEAGSSTFKLKPCSVGGCEGITDEGVCSFAVPYWVEKPQFSISNVINGKAVLCKYMELFFYSLLSWSGTASFVQSLSF